MLRRNGERLNKQADAFWGMYAQSALDIVAMD
jgi:hypothetical protein